MPVISNVLKYREIQREDVAWKLLHAQNAPFILAILDEHLGGEVNRRPVSELEDLVSADIEELRERLLDMPLSHDGKHYLERWRRDGYLVRKPSADQRQETYELSGGALTAISFAKGLAQPRRRATKSRLNIIFEQITALALEVGADDERRRANLVAERERIDAKLEALEAGYYQAVDAAEALEQSKEIIGLAKEIPLDFAYVSAEFERISKDLYAKLISYDDDYTDLLGDVFAGVDHIGQSPAGRSFRGFYDLLQDEDEYERVFDDIDVVLDAEFAQQLSADERRFFRRLMRTLLDQSRDVNDTMTGLARGLRRFVQSQSFQENRELKRLLDKSLALANELSDHVPPAAMLPLQLERTTTRVEPISRLKLRDPGDDALPAPASMEPPEEAPVLSLEELRAQIREVEIDFDELVGNVNDCLARALERDAGAVDLAAVLEAHPATQGVASVVGLMMLADEQGRRPGGTQRVSWIAGDGSPRMATIERYEFMQEVV